MADDVSVTVAFEIRGAICRQCDQRIQIERDTVASHAILYAFIREHEGHSLSWIARISSPPAMVTDQLMEIAIRESRL